MRLAKGGVFRLCLIDREDRALVRRFTKPVEVDLEASTLNGFGFHDGLSGGHPDELRGLSSTGAPGQLQHPPRSGL